MEYYLVPTRVVMHTPKEEKDAREGKDGAFLSPGIGRAVAALSLLSLSLSLSHQQSSMANANEPALPSNVAPDFFSSHRLRDSKLLREKTLTEWRMETVVNAIVKGKNLRDQGVSCT